MFMGTITELGVALADLVENHADWSRATFGSDAERGPIGPLKHLEKEANEATAAAVRAATALATDDDRAALKEELADCLLLVLDASRRGGVKVMQLIEAAQAKLKKNKARQWPKTSTNDPVEHVRQGE